MFLVLYVHPVYNTPLLNVNDTINITLSEPLVKVSSFMFRFRSLPPEHLPRRKLIFFQFLENIVK